MGRPVTHLVDRPRDRGKDRWMENSKAGGGGGGAIDTVGFGGRKRKQGSCVYQRGKRKKECISRDESILLTASLFSSFHHDQIADNEQLIILALRNNHT